MKSDFLNCFDNFIFDMDGTLLNSSKEVMMCLKIAFEKEKIDIDEARLTSNIIGPPLKDIVKLVRSDINEMQCERVVKSFREVYDYNDLDCSELYDGISELLNNLKENNKKMFIATYKPIKPSLRLIKKFNLTMFDDVYTIDRVENRIMSKSQMIKDILRRNTLDCFKTMMIGDALGDIIAAKENKVCAIGALWGYGDDKKPLIDAADFVANSIKELESLSFVSTT